MGSGQLSGASVVVRGTEVVGTYRGVVGAGTEIKLLRDSKGSISLSFSFPQPSGKKNAMFWLMITSSLKFLKNEAFLWKLDKLLKVIYQQIMNCDKRDADCWSLLQIITGIKISKNSFFLFSPQFHLPFTSWSRVNLY